MKTERLKRTGGKKKKKNVRVYFLHMKFKMQVSHGACVSHDTTTLNDLIYSHKH